MTTQEIEMQMIEMFLNFINKDLDKMRAERKALEPNDDMQRTFLDGGIARLIILSNRLKELYK